MARLVVLQLAWRHAVSGTSDSDRMFTASGLIPRTSYTFEVAAVSSEGTGPFSTGTTVETLKGTFYHSIP